MRMKLRKHNLPVVSRVLTFLNFPTLYSSTIL